MFPGPMALIDQYLGIHLPFVLQTFGIAVGVSLLVGTLVARKEFRRLYVQGAYTPHAGIRPEAIAQKTIFFSFLIAVAGARLYYHFEHSFLYPNLSETQVVGGAGFSYYGGFLLVGIIMPWFLARQGVRFWVAGEVLASTGAIMYGILRLGCQWAGHGDWGIVANLNAKPGFIPMWLWAESYPYNSFGFNLVQPVYPTPLYEAIGSFFVFGIIWKMRNHRHQYGWLLALYLLLMGLQRLLVERIRINKKIDIFGLQVTQAEIISLFLVIAGGFGVYRFYNQRVEK